MLLKYERSNWNSLTTTTMCSAPPPRTITCVTVATNLWTAASDSHGACTCYRHEKLQTQAPATEGFGVASPFSVIRLEQVYGGASWAHVPAIIGGGENGVPAVSPSILQISHARRTLANLVANSGILSRKMSRDWRKEINFLSFFYFCVKYARIDARFTNFKRV